MGAGGQEWGANFKSVRHCRLENGENAIDMWNRWGRGRGRGSKVNRDVSGASIFHPSIRYCCLCILMLLGGPGGAFSVSGAAAKMTVFEMNLCSMHAGNLLHGEWNGFPCST